MRLLEGLEITEVLLTELLQDNFVFRIDAEYFAAHVLEAIQLLHTREAVPLTSLAKITDGVHTSLPFIKNGPVKVLSAKHPKENYIDDSQFETVDDVFHAKNPRTALRVDDVLISTVGTIGNSAVVTTDLLPANSDRHIGIIRLNKETVSPYFLSTFLLSKYGRVQSNRETTGNVQPNLFISKIEQLLIPKFSEYFERNVAQIVRIAYQLRKDSAKDFEKAEYFLLQALGLENWQAPESLSYIRSSIDVFSAGRLDAEHFDERNVALQEILISSTQEYFTIGEFAPNLTNGAEIREYVENGTPYLRVGDIKNLTIEKNSVVYVDSLRAKKDLDKVPLQAGDILVSRSGSLAVTAVIEPEWSHALISSHLIRLKITDARFDPYYVALFLNSLPGKMQIVQWSNGGVQPEISQPSLSRVIVPLIDPAIQSRIRQSILFSRDKKQQAEKLLDAAKRAVEIAIEDSETAAMAYLEDFI